MPDGAAALTHADYQRAAALIGHEANGYAPGMQFVVDQTCAENRTAQLLLAVIDCYATITIELRTDGGLIAVWQLIEQETRRRNDDGDARRAATAIVARRDKDTAAFNTVLREANEAGRPAELLATVIGMYSAILPELATPFAAENLARWTVRIAGETDGGQG
ncbi:hypothetical protein QN239_27450 [Mycolicibacterium sp. Y3]